MLALARSQPVPVELPAAEQAPPSAGPAQAAVD